MKERNFTVQIDGEQFSNEQMIDTFAKEMIETVMFDKEVSKFAEQFQEMTGFTFKFPKSGTLNDCKGYNSFSWVIAPSNEYEHILDLSTDISYSKWNSIAITKCKNWEELIDSFKKISTKYYNRENGELFDFCDLIDEYLNKLKEVQPNK